MNTQNNKKRNNITKGKKRFGELLLQLSAKFVNVSSDKVDDEINDALKFIAEALDIDRILLHQFSEAGQFFYVSNYFLKPGLATPTRKITSVDQPFFTKSILKNNILKFENINDIPKGANLEKKYLKQQGVKSALAFPLVVGKNTLGALAFTTVSHKRSWVDKVVTQLQLISEVFANVLDRIHHERQLNHAFLDTKEQLQFEKLISSLSSIFINLPPEQIDQKINDGLKLISENLDFGRIALLQFSKDNKKLYLTHSYAEDSTQTAPKFLVSDKLPWFSGSIRKEKIIRISKIDEIPEKAVSERQYVKKQGIKAFVTLPLQISGLVIGGISYSSMIHERKWPDSIVQRLTLVNEIFANALDRKHKDRTLNKAYCEIMELKVQLQKENLYLREEIEVKHNHKKIIGQSEAILNVLSQIKKVASLDTNVLILGETGTGKELVADEIHKLSSRSKQLMIKVNCGALSPTLIENELFGREKGAYTGAVARQIGRFEAAHKSTLFLDEIAELSQELQVKLLRVLQEGKFERLGSTKTITVDVRIIAATNQDLKAAMMKGKFRKDLYYRLNVFPLTVPPLRDRREDIPLIIWHFVREFEKAMGKKVEHITEQSMKLLLSYSWPGNIREMRNIIERSIILNTGPVLRVSPLLIETENVITKKNDTLEDMTRNHILDILDRCGWQVGGINGAAQVLGLNRTTLISKMKKLQIKRS